MELRTWNFALRTSNHELRTSIIEPRITNLELRTSIFEPRITNLEPRLFLRRNLLHGRSSGQTIAD
jgi:hypothetical protein